MGYGGAKLRGVRRTAYWMVAPALFVVLAIVVYPLAFATYYSFREVRGNLVGPFVGFANYTGLFEDAAFSEALWTTLLFTVASAGLSFLAGLGLALLLAKPFSGHGAVAAAVFLPWIFPPVATATFGRLALDDGGFLQGLMDSLGLFGGDLLLGNRTALLLASVVVDVWRTAPFVALLLLAGLRTIPKDIYEAASIEGASALQRFYWITLPLLRPTILIVLLIRILDAFRVHDLFWVMGGRQLESLSIYVYQNVVLSQIDFGLGSAAAVFVFAFALSISLLFIVVLRAQVSTGLGQSGLTGDSDEIAAEPAYARHIIPLAVTGGLLALIVLAPLAWVFWLSSTPGEAGAFGEGSPLISLLTLPFTLLNPRIMLGLANSGVIAGATTFLTLALACPAAYAISRLGLPHGNGLLGVMLAIAFFPPAAVLVPMLVQLRELGIILGTQLGAVVPHTVFLLPFAIWLLATFLRELPVEVEDAAMVDGANRIQVLARVIVPLAAPAMFATGAFVFVLSWSEFVFASTFTFENSRPITAVLADAIASASVSIGPPRQLAAAALVAALPPMVLFLAFRRRILSGLTGDAFEIASTGDRPRIQRAVPKLAAWSAIGLLLISQLWALSLFIRYGVGALTFPYPLNYGEGPLLDQAVRLANFENIYRPGLSEPPFMVSNYPPLFPLVQAPLVWLFGPEFWYGRAISLASAAATTVFIALTTHALTRDRVASIAAGLTFPAIQYVAFWSSLVRVDSLALALSWAGLFTVARWPSRRKLVIFAALLLVAAILTRQSYALAAPLAAFVWLLREGRRRAFELAAIVAGGTLILFLALTLATGGGFYFHTVAANVNEFRWAQAGSYAMRTWFTMPVLVVSGIVFLFVAPWRGVRSWWLAGPYLIGATVSAVTVGKIGADVNYLLELSAALCLTMGAVIAWGRSRGWRTGAALILLLALQVVMMSVSLEFIMDSREDQTSRKGLARLEEIVKNSDGPVLADEQMGLLPLENRRIQLQPFEMTQLARKDKWDQRPLLREIRDKKFAAILIWKPSGAESLVRERWTKEMLEEIEANYEPAEKHASTTVYRPR